MKFSIPLVLRIYFILESAIHHRPKDSIIDYSLLLIDDDLILHEVMETACINGGMTGRYFLAVALVEPNL